MKIWRLVSGTLSIVLFFIVLFQAFAVGVVNVFEDKRFDTSDAGGVLVSFGLLVSGIVATALWQNKSKGGDIALIILYGLTAGVGYANLGTFGDLVIWSSWALVCALMAVYDYINNNSVENVEDDEESNAPMAECPNCHAKISTNSMFCGFCGYKMPEFVVCTNCGRPMPADAAFCPNCGAFSFSGLNYQKQQNGNHLETEIELCPNCGNEVKKDARFCPKCGTKII